MTFLIIIALLAVLGVLVTGVIGMAKGGEFNQKYSNKLMRARVILQLIAVLLIFFVAVSHG